MLPFNLHSIIIRNFWDIKQIIIILFLFDGHLINVSRSEHHYTLKKTEHGLWPVLHIKQGNCISRPPALCLASGPAPNLYLPALAPDLYLPALAPNLCLPALAPSLYLTPLVSNLCLPALAPNLCLVALAPNLYLLVMASYLLFTSSGQDFTTTTAATCTITTTTITTTTTTTATNTTRDNNKRCLRGSKIHIKWPLKDIRRKSQILFQ